MSSWKTWKFATWIFVHAPDGLKRVQVVFAGLSLDMRAFTSQPSARRMDPFVLFGEHLGDRMLRQPVHLQVVVQGTELGGDRDIAAGMAEADRRRHEQRSPPPCAGWRPLHPARPGRR